MHNNFLADIMICNRKAIAKTGEEMWICTLVKNVSWHSKNIVDKEKKGIVASKQVSIRIDERASCEKEFLLDGVIDENKHYTLQSGDVIFKVNEELLNGFDWQSGEIPLCGKERCSVTAWADNRSGILSHIYIQGE